MRIRLATDQDKQLWDAYVMAHKKGFAYHLYAWGKAVEAAYGHRSHYLLAEESRQICGILPLIVFQLPLKGRMLVSLPYCDVAGPLADSSETAVSLIDAANTESLGQTCAKHLELRLAAQELETFSEEQRPEKVLMLLPLPSCSETLLAGFKAKLRSQIKKPIRDGLDTKFGGTELLDDFYAVFSHNMRDLGSPVHSLRWFQAIVKTFADKARVAVVYTPEGKPVACGIILLHAKTVSLPWASALRNFSHLNANMLLYWTLLAFAADHGFERFDFGRSTPGEGSYRFKQQWGAEPVPLDWHILHADGHEERSAASQKGLARKIVESVWQQLPVSLCNVLGPKIRQYVSL